MLYLRSRVPLIILSIAFLTCIVLPCSGEDCNADQAKITADIRAVFDKPVYEKATWGLRLVDLETGKCLVDLQPKYKFFIGSVRKIFTIGPLLNEVGPNHRYDTPVYRRGKIDKSGKLTGDLILVASGDLTMGGRTNPDGTVAYEGFDHNEANSLGNAVLTAPNPLAGYSALARQVAAAGITTITGEVIIDDRLFQPFNFRGEFDVKPIFVNDDVVDVTINPTAAGKPASMVHRPLSPAFDVRSALMTGAPNSNESVELIPEKPGCIGNPGCMGEVRGHIPANLVPPMTNELPLVRTFRIMNPANYARTILIDELKAAGVKVSAPVVEENPTSLLPPRSEYSKASKVAELKGLPYSEDAKLILKVSYNIGADTSLVLWGLTHGVDSLPAALKLEKRDLSQNYGIDESEYFFVDGSGGGLTTATNRAVTQMFSEMYRRPTFTTFFDSLPIMGVDGSLTTFTKFESDPTLAGAKGQVHAKPGTFAAGTEAGLIVRGQAFGGYIKAKSGRQFVYQLVVNEVPIRNLDDLINIFQDQATISAMLWRDN